MALIKMKNHEQGYALLKALYKNFTGRETEVINIAQYMNVFGEIKNLFKTEAEFFDAVYTDVFRQVGRVAWNIEKVSNPYAFIERSVEDIESMKLKGYVYTKPIDPTDDREAFYRLPNEGETGYDAEVENELVNQWKKKDYPTSVQGVVTDALDFADHITYYRDKLTEASKNPYALVQMYSAIKQAWRNNWKQYKAMWNQSNWLGFLAYVADSDNRQIHLLTEYNTLYGTSLTAQNWYLPENIRNFAPWCYIFLNKVIFQMKEKNNLYMGNNKKEWYGKEYEYLSTPDVLKKVFLEEPFLLMKSYSNANVFNEGDLETAQVEQVKYWQNPLTPNLVKVGAHVALKDGEDKKVTTNFQSDKIFGIIYEPDMIATATYNEWEQDTGINGRTGAGNHWIHASATSYMNTVPKAVTIMMD